MRTVARGVALCCVFAVPAAAQLVQVRPPLLRDQWVWGLTGFAGIPLGDFRKHENGGGGIEFNLGFQPFRREPLLIRGHVATLIYGNVQATGFQEVCDFFSCRTETVRYTARNHVMTSLHMGPEFFATDGAVRPFAYALFGTTFFNSWANFQPEFPGGPSPGSVSLNKSRNFSTAYGMGARFVGTRFGREWGWELSARVNRNAKASYLTEDGLTYDEPSDTWTVTPTKTAAHVLHIHIGLWTGPFVNWNERRP